MNAVERMEVPAGLIGILRRVRQVIATIAILDDDLPMSLEVVGAQEKFLARGKEDVSVLQQATERDVVGIGKRRAVSPGPAIVFREKDFSLAESERLVVALRIDVRPLRREATPKVLGLTDLRQRRAAWSCGCSTSRRPWPPRCLSREIDGD